MNFFWDFRKCPGALFKWLKPAAGLVCDYFKSFQGPFCVSSSLSPLHCGNGTGAMPECRPSCPCRCGLWAFRRGPRRPPAPPFSLSPFPFSWIVSGVHLAPVPTRPLPPTAASPTNGAAPSKSAPAGRFPISSSFRRSKESCRGLRNPTAASPTSPPRPCRRRPFPRRFPPSDPSPTTRPSSGELPSVFKVSPRLFSSLAPPIHAGHRRAAAPVAPAWNPRLAGLEAGWLGNVTGLAPGLGRPRGRPVRAVDRPNARFGPALGPVFSGTFPAYKPAWADLRAGLHSNSCVFGKINEI